MKKLFSPFLFLLFVFCSLSLSSTAQDFEGVIYYEIPDMQAQGISQMSYMIKGDKTRLEFGNGQNSGSMIYLPEESKMVILIDAQKGYISMDADEDRSDMDDYSDVQATKTGETKTIAGKECEVWKVDSKENNVEACMAKGMGTFMMPKNPMGRDNTPKWAKELMDEGAMPLEVVEIKSGTRSTQMRATKIEERALPADKFVIPEGYKDMGAMLRQMQQMRKNGQ